MTAQILVSRQAGYNLVSTVRIWLPHLNSDWSLSINLIIQLIIIVLIAFDWLFKIVTGSQVFIITKYFIMSS